MIDLLRCTISNLNLQHVVCFYIRDDNRCDRAMFESESDPEAEEIETTQQQHKL